LICRTLGFDRLIVVRALDQLLVLRSAAVIVKDDPLWGHYASYAGRTGRRALI
jgi:hypothetical protein